MLVKEAYSFDDVLLVPHHGILHSRIEANISSELVEGWPLLVPIISANMPSVTGSDMAWAMSRLGAIGAHHRFCSILQQTENFKNSQYQGIISLGINEQFTRFDILRNRFGAKIFLIDVAHGDSQRVVEFIELLRKVYDGYLIAGNVATSDAAYRLVEAGVDAIKVGIGPGAACTTRETTGFGVPQITAINDCSIVKEDFPNIRIIADGGIKNSGDIVKALAAGADTVMVGSLLAGADEAAEPGVYYGNASKRINGHNAPEGVEGQVLRSGPVSDIIKKLAWGIRSGISYAGATNIKELRENAEWVRVTDAGRQESGIRI